MFGHLSEFVVALITMAGSLLTIYLKHLLDEKAKRKADPARTNHEHDVVLYTKLNEVLDKLSCDRAYIMQYHNGSHYSSGQSIMKISTTHEVTAPGISQEIANAQSLPMSLFNDVFKTFYRDGRLVIPTIDVAETFADSSSESIKKQGTRSSYAYPIKDLQGRFIGAVVVNYVTSARTLTEEQLHYIEQTAAQVSGYIRAILVPQ